MTLTKAALVERISVNGLSRNQNFCEWLIKKSVF